MYILWQRQDGSSQRDKGLERLPSIFLAHVVGVTKYIIFKLQVISWQVVGQVWLSLANSLVDVVCRYSLHVQLHPYTFLLFNISILMHFHSCVFLLFSISILANFYSQLGQRDCVYQLPIQIASCIFPLLRISILEYFHPYAFLLLNISILADFYSQLGQRDYIC